MIRNCIICKTPFKLTGFRRIKTAKYCSYRCYWSNKHDIPWNKGLHTGFIPKTAFKKGETRGYKFPKGHIPWNKGIIWEGIRRENHWNWQGGKLKKNRRGTMTYEEHRKYLDWQRSVFKRDNWECQFCRKHGAILHADHIKSWFLFPRLRFDINNGRTLCPSCHAKTHSYGKTFQFNHDTIASL